MRRRTARLPTFLGALKAEIRRDGFDENQIVNAAVSPMTRVLVKRTSNNKSKRVRHGRTLLESDFAELIPAWVIDPAPGGRVAQIFTARNAMLEIATSTSRD